MGWLKFALKLSHLLCFSTAWGSFVWTGLGGVITFWNVPKHQFGNLESKIFPAYFTLVTICCAISMASFGYLHPWKSSSSSSEKYQLGFLGFAFFFNLANLFIFSPMTLEMVKQRHKVERENKIGEEIGWTKNKQVAQWNTRLAHINKKFDLAHGFAGFAYVSAFLCLAIHSCYLASKLNI